MKNYHDMKIAPIEQVQECNEYARDLLAQYKGNRSGDILEYVERGRLFGNICVNLVTFLPILKIEFQGGVMKKATKWEYPNDPDTETTICFFEKQILNDKVSFKSLNKSK